MRSLLLLGYKPTDDCVASKESLPEIAAEGNTTRSEIHELLTGSPFNTHDVLFWNAKERELYIGMLRDLYGIPLTTEIIPVPSGISLTSLKCLIVAEDGQRYFLKQKADYCSGERQLQRSAIFQNVVAVRLHQAPSIVATRQGESHAIIGNRAFLLTPYVDGHFYMGRQEQSFSCAKTLAQMHLQHVQPECGGDLPLDSLHETREWISRLSQISSKDTTIKDSVLRQMNKITDAHSMDCSTDKGWLHGDFAPYNMVFGQEDSVLAVNDFDNVAFGPFSRDVAECILTHCGIMYAGPTSSLRAPICTNFDVPRAREMLRIYREGTGKNMHDLYDLRSQLSFLWLELLSLGVVRGDFSYRDVYDALANHPQVQNCIDTICSA